MKKEATIQTGLMDALVAAQAELETVKGTKENPFHNSTYAGLDDIVQTVLPVLSKHDIIPSPPHRGGSGICADHSHGDHPAQGR